MRLRTIVLAGTSALAGLGLAVSASAQTQTSPLSHSEACAELRTAVSSWTVEEAVPGEAAGWISGGAARSRQVFDALDRNENGVLEPVEMAACGYPLGTDTGGTLVDFTFFDATGNGLVTPSEFTRAPHVAYVMPDPELQPQIAPQTKP